MSLEYGSAVPICDHVTSSRIGPARCHIVRLAQPINATGKWTDVADETDVPDEAQTLGTGEAGTGEAGGRQSRQRWRLLDDPLAIRALAHPLRLDLMKIIARLGRATTADAAREMGISHGLASHHLRQLAKYGFLEQVKGKDHRERPWRLVATSYNWSGARATAEGSVAVDVLEQMTAERTIEAFLDWQQRRTVWPQAWREHTGLGESSVYLTQAELAGDRRGYGRLAGALHRRAADRRRGLAAGGFGAGDVHPVRGARRAAARIRG